MANAIVTVHGGPSSIATVLGQSPPRIPTAGKIRAGIKVLTRTAANHPRACEIYERGVAAGESFDQIERLLAEALPKLRNPLVPRYVFTGYPSELELAQVAVAALSIVPRRFGIAAEAQPVGTTPDDPLRGSKLGGAVLAMKACTALYMKSHRSTPWRRQVS